VIPVLESRLQRALDEQAAKAGAVDEEVALDDLALFELERFDESGGRVGAHLLDLALDAFHALGLGQPAQVTRVQGRVEVIGIVDARVFAQREAVFHGRQPLVTVLADVDLRALGLGVQPEVMELGHPRGLSMAAERVDVLIADSCPVLEPDAHLERGGALGHEILFVDT
jgi:hypothetical protein